MRDFSRICYRRLELTFSGEMAVSRALPALPYCSASTVQYLLTEWTIALYYHTCPLDPVTVLVLVPCVRFANRRVTLDRPDKGRRQATQRNATQCPAVPCRIVMIPEFYFFPLFLSVNLPSSPSIHLPPTNSTNHNYTHTTS